MSHNHSCSNGNVEVTRRSALLAAGAMLAVGGSSAAFAQTTGVSRLIVVNVRGGLDGLSVVVPYGDPNLSKLRAPLMASPVGTSGGMLDLGGFFGLHPAMPNFQAMFKAGQAAAVHAVGNIAQTRSHFVGQDYLQGGASQFLGSGWLNRALSGLPQPANGVENGVCLSACAPLLMRGAAGVAGWAPDPFAKFNPSYASALVSLSQTDPLLAPAYVSALRDRSAFDAVVGGNPRPQGLSPLQSLAWVAGSLLATSGGPTVATLETESYDTHVDQVARLALGLADLDGAILAIKQAMGGSWAKTVVVTITEFGRTAYFNGSASGGTDHGTAFAVLLAGGAVNGGRVITTWPGLAPSQLFQGRDLAPTMDVRSILSGLLRDHLGASSSTLSATFPSANVSVVSGLVRTSGST